MSASLTNQKLRLFLDIADTVFKIPKWFFLSHNAHGGVSVKEDAFGVNVASSEDPRCDDYVVNHLTEAGITHVRLCWDEAAQQNYTKRFLDRLLAENFDVVVSLLPSFEDARRLETDPSALTRWRQFLKDFFQSYGTRVPLCEIGNTPNRPKWSGHTPTGYLMAWEIAVEEANLHKVALAGPNISDFEPAFNYGYLKNMQRSGNSPSVHTDNLFVERAVEPEQYDPSVFGKLLANPIKLNLAKKINLLSDISTRHGVDRTFCTYACWTRKRLNRWTTFGEAKSADYLVRYLVVCAAAEGLDRVYWGPLIDSRDGIIDCGSEDYPEIDNVSHYKSVRGAVEDFSPNPSFFSYKFITNLLKNTYCHQGIGDCQGVNHYIFSDEEHDHHIIWAPDGFAFDATSLYPDHLDTALARDTYGKEIVEPYERLQITESPLVLTWNRSLNTPRPSKKAIQDCAPFGPAGTVHVPQNGWKTVAIDEKEWHGIAKLPAKAAPQEALALVPGRIHDYPVLKKLRDKRNKLWSIDNPSNDNMLVIKENRARGIKRFSYLLRDSKGKRHWNTATEMLRRGINTPEPIAYIEQKRFSGIKDNYYIAEFLNDAFSTRDLFTAFSAGEASYRGISKQEWLTIVAQFVALMHRKKIIHRDLSSGNLMVTMNDGKPKVYAIDIGRAQVDQRQKVLLDIKRICYKLGWPDRKFFVAQYHQAIPGRSLRFWRAAVYGYDLKLASKKRIKGLLPGRRKAQKLRNVKAG